MPSCVINCCKNNSCFEKKCSGITFHKFPTEMMWKENWVEAVRVNRNDADWLPSKFSVICSLHFEECDTYNTKGGYRRIKKNATPKKIFLVNSEWCQEKEQPGIHPESLTQDLNRECKIEVEVDVADNFEYFPMYNTSEKKSNPQEHISNYESGTSDSEIESLFDTPKISKLRQQARKYKSCYKIHVRKIKTLNQKVKRLIKKNALLKTALKELKEKRNSDTNAR